MKTYLFMVTEINSANGICCRSIMNELSNRGNKILCITNNELTAVPLDKNIQYFTVKPRLSYRLFNKSMQNQQNGVLTYFSRYFAIILNKLKLLISIPTWPFVSPLYSYRYYKSAKKICTTNNIDFIIPIYTQIDPIIAANKIKHNNPNIQYIPYFLDSLSGGYGPQCFTKKQTIRRGLKWENKLLKNADMIIAMKSSFAHHKTYSEKMIYYSKFIYLDIPLLMPFNNEQLACNLLEKDKINLMFIGTIPVHIRNPKYFLDVFSLIDDPRLRLTIIGTNTCPNLLKVACEHDDRIKLLPFISHEEAVLYMQAADVLINFGNNNRAMTPSKIFEYMSTGKPIISTAPINDEPSIKYLEKYPLSFVMKENNKNIKTISENLYDFIISNKGKEIDVRALEKIFYLNTPNAFIDSITALN